MAVLTGAHSDGCGGVADGDGDGQGGHEPVCAPDSHLELVCDEDGTCVQECVPETCPDGTVPEWVCEGIAHPGDDCGGGGECYLTCVPADPCGPGEHEEWVCEEGPVYFPDPACDDCAMPPPPEECFPICVPDECPPGQVEVIVCEDGPTDPEDPIILPASLPPEPVEECFVICMDEGEPPPEPEPQPAPAPGID